MAALYSTVSCGLRIFLFPAVVSSLGKPGRTQRKQCLSTSTDTKALLAKLAVGVLSSQSMCLFQICGHFLTDDIDVNTITRRN